MWSVTPGVPKPFWGQQEHNHFHNKIEMSLAFVDTCADAAEPEPPALAAASSRWGPGHRKGSQFRSATSWMKQQTLIPLNLNSGVCFLNYSVTKREVHVRHFEVPMSIRLSP